MEKAMTRKAFKAQFPYPCTFADNLEPRYEQTVQGVEVYRVLNELVIKGDDGQFYAHG